MVVLSRATPRSAKYSHSSGTITPSEAVSALTVSRPSEGWQSIRMTSYCSIAGGQHPLQGLLAADLVDQLHLGGGQVDVGRAAGPCPGTPLGTTTSSRVDVALHQQVVDRSAPSGAGSGPRPTESEPCGSKSTSSTLRPYSASEAPRLIVVVVLPTPPFWLHIEMTRALPWVRHRPRLGEVGHRPAGGAEDDLVGRLGRWRLGGSARRAAGSVGGRSARNGIGSLTGSVLPEGAGRSRAGRRGTSAGSALPNRAPKPAGTAHGASPSLSCRCLSIGSAARFVDLPPSRARATLCTAVADHNADRRTQ